MTVLIDSAVFMYSAGGDHPLREPCRVVLQRAAVHRLDGTISAEIVQEILHRYVALRRSGEGVRIAREALIQFRPVLPVNDATIRLVPDLVERYPTLQARDLVHAATCIENGISTIISPDRGLDLITEIRRIDPVEAAA